MALGGASDSWTGTIVRLSYCIALWLAATLFPHLGGAQVPLPSRIRIDSVSAAPLLSPFPPANGARASVCADCHGWGWPSGAGPALIIKDSAARVLAMFPPGDSAYRSDPDYAAIDPEMIAAVQIVPDTAVRPLGPGFENGIVIITLSSAGTQKWRALVARNQAAVRDSSGRERARPPNERCS